MHLATRAKSLGVEVIIPIADTGNPVTDEYERLLSQAQLLPFVEYPHYYVPSENDVMVGLLLLNSHSPSLFIGRFQVYMLDERDNRKTKVSSYVCHA